MTISCTNGGEIVEGPEDYPGFGVTWGPVVTDHEEHIGLEWNGKDSAFMMLITPTLVLQGRVPMK